jgi:hypothetical protein
MTLHNKHSILVIGFYGIVKDHDLEYIFGKDSIRIPFKDRKKFIFKAKWPEDWNSSGYLELSEAQLSEIYHLFVKTISRFNVYSGWDLNTIDVHFYEILIHAYNFLKSNNIRMIIFQDPPHTAWEVIIYILSKINKLKTIICRQSLLLDGFFAMHTLGGFNNYIPSDKKYNLPENWFSYNYENLDLFYMKQIKPNRNIYQWFLSDLVSSVYNGWLTRPKYFKSLMSIVNDIKLFFDFRHENKIKNLSLKELPNYFVYVPLHLQPEMTTSTLGGKYYNQLFMVYQLRAIVPHNIPIVIKENPKQWIHGRGIGFYSKLRKIDNVFFAEKQIDSLEMIRKSVCTATITGTAGWETLKAGKPVIYFGYPWYSHIYGAFAAEKNIFERIQNFIPDESKYRETLESLAYKIFKGAVINAHRYRVADLSYSKNLQLLKSSFNYLINS